VPESTKNTKYTKYTVARVWRYKNLIITITITGWKIHSDFCMLKIMNIECA